MASWLVAKLPGGEMTGNQQFISNKTTLNYNYDFIKLIFRRIVSLFASDYDFDSDSIASKNQH